MQENEDHSCAKQRNEKTQELGSDRKPNNMAKPLTNKGSSQLGPCCLSSSPKPSLIMWETSSGTNNRVCVCI